MVDKPSLKELVDELRGTTAYPFNPALKLTNRQRNDLVYKGILEVTDKLEALAAYEIVEAAERDAEWKRMDNQRQYAKGTSDFDYIEGYLAGLNWHQGKLLNPVKKEVECVERSLD